MDSEINNEAPFCKCGCGKKTKWSKSQRRWNTYLNGHHARGKKRSPEKPIFDYTIDQKGCWNFNGYVDSDGYGTKCWRGKVYRAHRLMYLIEYEDLQSNMVIDHKCSNRKCINPKHLEQVTHTQNVRRGKCSKLTDEQVEEIKAIENMTQRKIADIYGVSESQIRDIRNGRYRSDVKKIYDMEELLVKIQQFDFESRCEVDKNSCHLWKGKRGYNGYSRVRIGGKIQLAHRAVWISKNGWIPKGMEIDHTCHVRHCVNIEHLRLATPAQNSQSRRNTKLTMEVANQIREEIGSLSQVAKKYGTSPQMIYKIKNNKSWIDPTLPA